MQTCLYYKVEVIHITWPSLTQSRFLKNLNCSNRNLLLRFLCQTLSSRLFSLHHPTKLSTRLLPSPSSCFHRCIPPERNEGIILEEAHPGAGSQIRAVESEQERWQRRSLSHPLVSLTLLKSPTRGSHLFHGRGTSSDSTAVFTLNSFLFCASDLLLRSCFGWCCCGWIHYI